MNDFRVSYAQNREDVLLSGFFPPNEKGFYVDIGASHPEKMSVTKFFYDKGWRGLNVEPIPRLYKLLAESRARDINVNAGISDKAGSLKLREYVEADGLSTLSKEVQNTYEKHEGLTDKYIDREVKVITLAELFAEHKVGDISFMKVDVEGFEYQVLSSNDWAKYRPQVLCIEANHIIHDWRPLLESHGYELIFFDGLNNYYVDKSRRKGAKPFSYIDTILEGALPIPAKADAVMNQQRLETDRYRKEVDLQREEVGSLKHEVNRLNFELAEARRLTPLVKQLFRSLDAAMRVRIENLNVYKPKALTEVFSFDPKADRATLLSSIRLHDMSTYYTRSAVKPRLVYRIVLAVYQGVYKLAFRVGIIIFAVLRRMFRR